MASADCDGLLCRFTKDTESVDTSVSYSVQSFMTCSISVFGAMLVVTAVTPSIIVAIALLSIVYYRIQVSHPAVACCSGSANVAECGHMWCVK